MEAWAAAELRSINGQIEYLLRQAVARRKGAVTFKSSGGNEIPGSRTT